MVWPNPSEVAVLTVNGSDYRDWETVAVRHALKEHPWINFRFTCSEGVPLAKNFAAMRIIPGMECSVTLGGQPAVKGLVSTRQVFYDARRHHIEIQGASETQGLTATAITKTGESKNVTYEQYARQLLQPTKLNLVVEGGQLPQTKFPRISIPPGTSILEALEIPLRGLGSVSLTSNVKGDVVAAVGPSGGEDTVEEGKNILEAREIIYNLGMAQGTYGIGQKPGTDQEHGAKVASVPFLSTLFPSFAQSYAPAVLPLEFPAWSNDFLKGRTGADRDWMTEDQVTVFATVQGWLRPSGGLWQRNQSVRVKSPMLVMDGGVSLTAKSVTFTQDIQSGTRTVLELCNAAALAGLIPQGPGAG